MVEEKFRKEQKKVFDACKKPNKYSWMLTCFGFIQRVWVYLITINLKVTLMLV